MGFSHMAPIDFNGSHAAPSPRAPLGVTLSPDVCALLHALALRGRAHLCPALSGRNQPPSPSLPPTPLALWISNNGGSFLWQVSKIYTINITLQGSDTVLFSNTSTLCCRSVCHTEMFPLKNPFLKHIIKISSIEIPPFAPSRRGSKCLY